MVTTVDFIDSIHGHSWSIELQDQDEIFLNDVWYKEDALLVGLSQQEPFVGRTTWSDLEMVHYQILLFKAFDHLDADTPMDEISIRYREPFSTFRFLSAAVSKFAKLEGIAGFENISIYRPKDNRVIIDFRRVFRFDWDSYVPPRPKPKGNPFQVIVDNTK